MDPCQALATQGPAIEQHYDQVTDGSQLQQQGVEHSLMNLQPDECCSVNHDSQGVTHNTRSKRKVVEYAVPTMPNQDSTSSTIPHATISSTEQPVIAILVQNQNTRGSNEPRIVPNQSSMPMMTKAPRLSVNAPLNIVDQMKRKNLSVSMWDILSIPTQRDLLQKELKTIVVQSQLATTHDAVSYVQPTKSEKEGETSKKQKPPPFYVSFIIGDMLVHNYMVGLGASSSVMPRSTASMLGIEYEPIIKIVLQLDGSIVKTIGVIKGLKMALHAFPSCTISQDISIIELPPHFAMCLSRDFTTQISGYIASNWSYMFCRTRYGTKTSIRVEPLADHHIEPYMPSPINMNYTILDGSEEDTIHDSATAITEVPDYLLDEWATNLKANPIKETGLGTYYILENDAPTPNLMKEKKDTDVL